MSFLYEMEIERRLNDKMRCMLDRLDEAFNHLIKDLGEVDKETLSNIRSCLAEFENIKTEVKNTTELSEERVQSLLKSSEEHIEAQFATLKRKFEEVLESRFPTGYAESEVEKIVPTAVADFIEEENANILTVDDIVHTLGDSEDKVISQKGLTENISTLFVDTEIAFNKSGYVINNTENTYSPDNAINTGLIPLIGYISVKCTSFLTNAGNVIAFFDGDKNFISGVSGNADAGQTEYQAEIPINATYAICSHYDNDSVTPKCLLITDKENVANRAKRAITENDIECVINESGNVFRKDKVKIGYEVYGDGSIVSEANSAVSDYINVKGHTTLHINNLPIFTGLGHYAYFYDENKAPIGSLISISSSNSTASATIPGNACYFVFSVYQRYREGDKDYENVVVSFEKLQEYSPAEEVITKIKGYNLKPLATQSNDDKPTKNKKMIIFGDSITETATMDDNGNNYQEHIRVNWLDFASSFLQTTNYKNYAKSGACYKDRTGVQYRQCVSEQIALAMVDSNNDDAEIVVVSLGTNDGNTSMGDYSTAMSKSNLGDLDRTKLYEAIRWVMWTLREKYVNATFFVATPIQRAYAEQPPELIEAITKMAKRYNFIIIDGHNESGIIRDFEISSASGRDLYDGLHPNTNGVVKMAKLYANTILRNFAYI